MPTTIARSPTGSTGTRRCSGPPTAASPCPAENRCCKPRLPRRIFRHCKSIGLHTALDTSGFLGARATDALLDDIDLVLLDVKSGLPETYREVTGRELAPTLAFGRRLADRGKPIWIRYVLVPGLTDAVDNVDAVADYVAGLQDDGFPPGGGAGGDPAVPPDGRDKWQELGLAYPLEDTQPPSDRTGRAGARAVPRPRADGVLSTRLVRSRRRSGSRRSRWGGGRVALEAGAFVIGIRHCVQQPAQRVQVAVGRRRKGLLDEVVARDVERVDPVHQVGIRSQGAPAVQPGVERRKVQEDAPCRFGIAAGGSTEVAEKRRVVDMTLLQLAEQLRDQRCDGTRRRDRRTARAWPASRPTRQSLYSRPKAPSDSTASGDGLLLVGVRTAAAVPRRAGRGSTPPRPADCRRRSGRRCRSSCTRWPGRRPP